MTRTLTTNTQEEAVRTYDVEFGTNEDSNWSKVTLLARDFHEAYLKATARAEKETAKILKADKKEKPKDRLPKSFQIEVDSIKFAGEVER
jgi:hypothetical protein